jgi:hypothetical protein
VRRQRRSTSTTSSRLARLATLLAVAVGVATVIVAVAVAKMQSTKVDRHLCETTHGGKFVDIPGFPGEQIDRRLLADVRWLVRKYHIFVTDGYALHGHAPDGEHPIGLALDIVPDKAAGGSWREVTKLARWAEPEPDQPRPPFRWVGYNGDSGHGRGHHLHLSWLHSETEPANPARVVYTRHCPDKRDGRGSRDEAPRDEAPRDEQTERGNRGDSEPQSSGPGGVGADEDYTGDGGISPKKLKRLRAIGPQHD